MISTIKACSLLGVTLLVFALAPATPAQELKKVRADYHPGAVDYSPNDPWTRSKVFQSHTGHSGFFYNCDEEECKRNSPYIYWTSNHQPLWPERIRLIDNLRRDLDKVRWRINAGSCGCEECLNERPCKTRCQSPGRDGCKVCGCNSTDRDTIEMVEKSQVTPLTGSSRR